MKERDMRRLEHIKRTNVPRLVALVIVGSVVIAACSSSSDSAAPATVETDGGERTQASPEDLSGEGAYDVVTKDGAVVFQSVGAPDFDAKIIRDGRVELRIDQGSFGSSAGQIRAIAADLGGYVASGETYIEETTDERYAVGWYTIRIPSDRFDDAVNRIEQLGDPVSASLTSQDVTEEYVDLEARLNYWREQEQFYTRLMDEATSIDDLVTLQTRMQEVLLNIEQAEGRLRYLDSRTQFASLTVGLTEVPGGVLDPVKGEGDKGPIAEAFDQAGEVLLATVSFLIVAAAVAIPIGILVLFAYGFVRLFSRATRKETPAEG
jgi:hypothetical protein